MLPSTTRELFRRFGFTFVLRFSFCVRLRSGARMTAPLSPALLRPRRAGVLLPLFSIRTQHGWGLGEIADIPRFARWARGAGLSVLQLLPVNEVSGGETSPYAAATAFALDPIYLALDDCEDFAAAGGRAALPPGTEAELARIIDAPTVDWTAARKLKTAAQDRAFAHFEATEWRTRSARALELERFVEQHRDWLDDYTLFAAIHEREQRAFWDWPAPLAQRQPAALTEARALHATAILRRAWLEWQLDQQWTKARREAAALGVALKGDLPFMVAGDSADVWSRPEDFRRDRRVGTPPDAFSATGQDWGLPAYDWETMDANGYAWLHARAARSGALFDLYRVDHVIGLYRTYTRPVAATLALADAEPEEGPGFMPAVEKDQIRLGETVLGIFKRYGEVIAEDLGMVPPFLLPSLERLAIPGYKVQRWEKDADVFRDPRTWPALSVATSGTHDIEPNAVWYDALSAHERERLLALPALAHLDPDAPFDDQVRDALLGVVYAAPSMLAITPFQDLFGARERINLPGTVSATNWTYRMPMDLGALAEDRAARERLTALAARSRRGIHATIPTGGPE
jgi:4-alpha-glucanotransferase